MKFIIPVVVIAIFLGILYFRIRKQRNLLKMGEEYEKLLRDARVTRYQYTEALQKTREIVKEVEHVEDKLTSVKAEIYNYQKDIREKIGKLREQRAVSTNSELDKRTLAQMKNALAELWMHTDARKKACLEVENALDAARKKLREAENEENNATEKWTGEKDAVMRTYRKLKEKMVITDPMKYFS